jgi:predicted nucleotidyltransferase
VKKVQGGNMLTHEETAALHDVAHRFGATEVYLFGSSLNSETARDIDLGVRGIAPENFFDFYGELIMMLPRPVDLVNLEKPSLFCSLIMRDGVKVYG